MGQINPNIPLDKARLPRHVGFIMDGNGRWAKKRLLPRSMGHREGARVFRRVSELCRDMGIECATFYAFSTENRSRPRDEVEGLIRLFDEYLDEIKQSVAGKNERVVFLGDLSFFGEGIQAKAADITSETRDNTGFTCAVAVNYGGQDEIIRAVNLLIRKGDRPENLPKYLYTADLPELDLIIRTAGEQRLSNFLTWQSAYAELYFSGTLWPDFSPDDLHAALSAFAERKRKFGKTVD
jgi:undecaprenyl diphosphate synthase